MKQGEYQGFVSLEEIGRVGTGQLNCFALECCVHSVFILSSYSLLVSNSCYDNHSGICLLMSCTSKAFKGPVFVKQCHQLALDSLLFYDLVTIT